MRNAIHRSIFVVAGFVAMACAAASAQAASEARDGAWIARHVEVAFDPLPPGWIAEQNPMDDIWQPLGLRGVNYYAYGGRTSADAPASRADPDSPLYQAWFGVYVVAGDEGADIATALRIADLDQASWLQAMGDAHPLGLAAASREKRGTLRIDGAQRDLYYFSGRSHSDLSAAATPLARHVGMPPESDCSGKVAPFHDLELRGYMAAWHDAKRDLTFVVYATAPVFRTRSGETRDDFAGLDAAFRRMMRKVRIASIGHSRNRNDVHVLGQPMHVCDAASFRLLDDELGQKRWAVDDRCAYRANRRLAGADSESFRVLDTDCAKDDVQAYSSTFGVIHGADAATFALAKGPCTVCVRDKYRCDNSGKPAPCNPEFFKQ